MPQTAKAMLAIATMLGQATGLPAAPVWRKDAPVPPPSSMEVPVPAEPTVAAGTANRAIERSPDGHYYLTGLVNGVGVAVRGIAWVNGAIDHYIVDGAVNFVAEGLLSRGLIPRTFPDGHPLAHGLRLTVRNREQDDRLIEAATAIR